MAPTVANSALYLLQSFLCTRLAVEIARRDFLQRQARLVNNRYHPKDCDDDKGAGRIAQRADFDGRSHRIRRDVGQVRHRQTTNNARVVETHRTNMKPEFGLASGVER